jgi:hypothetical protein
VISGWGKFNRRNGEFLNGLDGGNCKRQFSNTRLGDEDVRSRAGDTEGPGVGGEVSGFAEPMKSSFSPPPEKYKNNQKNGKAIIAGVSSPLELQRSKDGSTNPVFRVARRLS